VRRSPYLPNLTTCSPFHYYLSFTGSHKGEIDVQLKVFDVLHSTSQLLCQDLNQPTPMLLLLLLSALLSLRIRSSSSIQLSTRQPQDGRELGLLVKLERLGRVPVEMDGERGDTKERAAEVDEFGFELGSGRRRRGGGDDDSACEGEISVEPGSPDASSIGLYGDLEVVSLCRTRQRGEAGEISILPSGRVEELR
jgi:hypothetical protein